MLFALHEDQIECENRIGHHPPIVLFFYLFYFFNLLIGCVRRIRVWLVAFGEGVGVCAYVIIRAAIMITVFNTFKIVWRGEQNAELMSI